MVVFGVTAPVVAVPGLGARVTVVVGRRVIIVLPGIWTRTPGRTAEAEIKQHCLAEFSGLDVSRAPKYDE